MVRLISMAMTGYYRTLMRPRLHRPLSMMKYDPIGTQRQHDPPYLRFPLRARAITLHRVERKGTQFHPGMRRRTVQKYRAAANKAAVRKQVLFLEQKRGKK